MRPGQPVRPLEGEQVLADRLLRDVEPLGELRDEDTAVLLDHPVDLLLPFLGEHWASLDSGGPTALILTRGDATMNGYVANRELNDIDTAP